MTSMFSKAALFAVPYSTTCKRYMSSYSTFTSRSTRITWQISSTPFASTQSSKRLAALMPRNILILRHGESMGNQDESLYGTIPDWKLPLSQKGRIQARAAGKRIQQLIGPSTRVIIYVSPYVRTKQTLQELRLPNPVLYTREEPRLREQDFGNFQHPTEIQKEKENRIRFGRFFFRFPHGESGADVFDRVSAFTGTFIRDMEQLGSQHADKATTIFVTHGITSRLFLMKWFHWSVDDFEALHNPPNCGLLHLKRTDNGYQLLEESRQLIKGPVPQCETGIGRGLQLGEILRKRRRGLTAEDRRAFDSLKDAAYGL